MFDAITCYLNQIFLYGLSLDFKRDEQGEKIIRLKLKDFLIKDDLTSGVIIESLVLSVLNLEIGQGCQVDPHKASYVVEKLTLILSQDWVNRLLEKDETLKKQGAKNVRVDFIPDMVRISGEFKVGLNVKASVYLKLDAEDGKLRINLDKVTALDKISLPKFIQKAVIGLIEKYAREKLPEGVSFFEGGLLIDFLAMIPVDLHLELKNVYLDEENLAIQGGVDFKQAAEKIRIRRQEIEQEQARKEELRREEEQEKEKARQKEFRKNNIWVGEYEPDDTDLPNGEEDGNNDEDEDERRREYL